MTINDLQRVQEIDYELLCEIDRICRKHNIHYFLFYGTLLGAIRHKGFIPWDDDVDICMMRKDYLHFYDVAQKELDATKYYCKIMGSGSLKYLSELKIGKKGTLYCMPGTEGTGVADNVSLDIFCLEPAKKHSYSVFRFYYKIWSILRLVKQNRAEKHLLNICIEKSENPFRLVYKIGLWCSDLIRIILGEELIEKIGYKMLVDEHTDTDSVWDSSMPLLYEKKWFENSADVAFGEGVFPAPAEYNDFLKHVYGNYMELPPEGKRYQKYFDIWLFKDSEN